tara:strand:+ start:5336 stop:5686 length:351 start_codon:yes stop_codon:yes gene_type:complete
MTNINKLVLAGRLTRDVDTRSTAGGVVARIGMAVNRKKKEGDKWVDEATYVNVTMFGKRAEAFARYHSKGSQCCFPNARLAFNSWEKDGEKRSELYVVAEDWEFIGSKGSDDNVPF